MPYKDEDLNRSAFLCKSTTNPNPRKKRVQDSFFITKSPALALLQSNQNYKGYQKFYGITLSSSFFLGVTGLCSFKEGKWGGRFLFLYSFVFTSSLLCPLVQLPALCYVWQSFDSGIPSPSQLVRAWLKYLAWYAVQSSSPDTSIESWFEGPIVLTSWKAKD